PVLGDVLDYIRVDFEGEGSVVVSVPIAVLILDAVGNCAPGLHLIGRQQAVGLRGGAERKSHVDDIGGLGAGIVLVGFDGLDLFARRAVGVELVDRDAVLIMEDLNSFAVVDPVVGKGDYGQLALFLSGRDESLQV